MDKERMRARLLNALDKAGEQLELLVLANKPELADSILRAWIANEAGGDEPKVQNIMLRVAVRSVDGSPQIQTHLGRSERAVKSSTDPVTIDGQPEINFDATHCAECGDELDPLDDGRVRREDGFVCEDCADSLGLLDTLPATGMEDVERAAAAGQGADDQDDDDDASTADVDSLFEPAATTED